MSQGDTPAPIIVPHPKPVAPAWMNILVLVLTAIAGLLTGPHVVPSPTPTPVPPPKPEPKPFVIPDDSKPTPNPNNNVQISVTDVRGNLLSGGVDSGTMFLVKTDEGSSLLGIPQPTASSGDTFTLAANEIICDLKPGATGLQVIVYGSGKPTVMMIQCNVAPQPPPIPTPQPQPQPTPPPSPGVKLSLAVVEDSLHRTAATAATLNDITSWNSFISKGHEYRIYDITTTEEKGKTAIAAAKANNLPPPVLVIMNKETRTVLKVVPLPKPEDLIGTVSAFGG